MVYQVKDKQTKVEITRNVLEALPDWFGLEDSRKEYIADSAEQTFFAFKENGQDIGFVSLKETGESTVELAVMGVLQQFHRQGFGTQLVKSACEYAKNVGYEFIQVKTVATGHYDIYDNTNCFYKSLGFKEFEIFPTLWGELIPCQIYVMSLK